MTVETLAGRLGAAIRNVPDFPKAGIQFKDITPVLLDPDLFDETLEALAEYAGSREAQKIAGVDARGFLFAAPVANRLGVGLIPIRKTGKLPYETRRESYDLEYGANALEIHVDAVEPGERIVLIDDLLATGGTMLAAARLVEALGGRITGMGFVVELAFLDGRSRLAEYDCTSMIAYSDGEEA